jgi:hypothetical protein
VPAADDVALTTWLLPSSLMRLLSSATKPC